MTKHLVDIDEVKLEAGRAEFGTTTIKDTIDEALRRAIGDRLGHVATALDRLAAADLSDRDEAWR